MNIEELRTYCLSKKGTEECFPFDDSTLVFKVMDKMYALIPLERDLQVNLKCGPELALELREQYPCVTPGYHMNKTHWNTVIVDGSVSDRQIYEWVDHSYNTVLKGLGRKARADLMKPS